MVVVSPISPVGLNTGSWSPYFARWAQYGLLAAIARWAIRRLPGVALRLPRAVFWRPFRALVVWTIGIPGLRYPGLRYPGLRYATPRAVFWRPFRAPIPPRQICHICRRQMSKPPRQICHICRRQMSKPPRQICHICRRQMSNPPRQICHICRRQMSKPPRHLWRGGGRQAGGEVTLPLAKYVTSAAGRCPTPLAIYGEGVADRPGVRSSIIEPRREFRLNIAKNAKNLSTLLNLGKIC